MAVNAYWYGKGLIAALNKEIDWDTDTIKVALATSGYSPNQDTHDYWNDVSACEVIGTGYTASGVTASAKTANYTAGTNEAWWDADDVSWANSTIPDARYAIVYDASGGAASLNALIAYVDFGQTFATNNGTFLIQWSASGIVRITASA